MPVFELQKQYLKYLYENLIEKPRQKKAQIIRIPTKYLERLDNLIENNKECSKAEEKFHENFKRSYSLEKSAINAISIKEKKLWEFYVSALFSLIDCADEDKEVSFLSFENKEMFRFRINNNVGLSLPDFSFKILFRRLSTGNIIKILKYILLESQIIFFANNTSEIVTITETLLSLISPL